MSNNSARIPRAWKGAGVALACAGLVTAGLTHAPEGSAAQDPQPVAATTTPIKHVVVLFDENESFDHYFGTYPQVAYPKGEDSPGGDGVPFTKSGTPRTSDGKPIDNYVGNGPLGDTNPTYQSLVTNNPNSIKPFRLTHEQAWTCSQNHGYTPEEKAVSGVLADGTTDGNDAGMDTFVQNTTNDSCTSSLPTTANGGTGQTMGYYDGNTVTGLWNYAQNYAMSENSWADNFGPSTVGALNVVSGQTHGVKSYNSVYDASTNPNPVTDPATSATAASGTSAYDANGVGTVIGDPDPVYDDCANLDHTRTGTLGGMQDTNKNIGDLLNAGHDGTPVTWGYFAGGFTPTTPWNGTAGSYAQCDAKSANIAHTTGYDYNPHHNPFAYYKSTSNPHHYPGTPGKAIGADDPTSDATKMGANHQYDLSVFYDALDNHQLPAVSYVKPIYAEDGHPANSDPLDEQRFLVRTINAIEQSPEWRSTAIFIAYDDSDGWYDHVAPEITNGSNTSDDAQVCTSAPTAASPAGGYQDRCGPSQRLPLLLISPFAKRDYVSNTHTSQASIVKFIEDNFGLDPIGDGSFDATAGSLNDMFDFKHPRFGTTLLRPADGTIKATTKSPVKLTAKQAVSATRTAAHDTVTVKGVISGTSYAPVGNVTAKVNGKVVKTAALSSTGQVVFSRLTLKKPVWKKVNGKLRHVLQSNTLVFTFGATPDYSGASVTVTVRS